MIGRIKGQLVEVVENVILLDAGGVAYEVELTSTALARLPARDQQLSLYTHFVVREDAQLLYGFATREERDLFRVLIRINGVGPKLAVKLISSIDLHDLAVSVANKDVAMLMRVPGVGRKTAERLLVELKDKLGDLVSGEVATLDRGDNRAALEAEGALISLGYKSSEAARVINSVRSEGGNAEDLLRAALQRIGKVAEVVP
ncbi:MAG: Holliday junction branch migration protein RuvA [Gammaproteobacteria bacterium]|nr:Holliday junction branch migration protein RuvA [Pseudomonadota bacterium]TDJ30898.1 MAG: Holliday junction branch migration protein RuvA [Gammaproteobacteria bacterium]TDJ36848.1 MAG: Holliday junction branch migration protein RuvA [Gammaproteobacteria bacterium]